MTVVNRFLNTGSTAGGDGTTNATAGANRAWASMEEVRTALLAAYPTGLVAADVQVNVECSGATNDTTTPGTTWPTSDTTRYVHFSVPSADRKVAWDDAVYTLERTSNGGPVFTINTNSIRVTGVQFYHSNTTLDPGNHGLSVLSLGGELYLDGVKMRRVSNVSSIGGFAFDANGKAGTFVFRNVVTWNFTDGIIFQATPSNSTIVIYNPTIVGLKGDEGEAIWAKFAGGATNAVARIKNALMQRVMNGITTLNATTDDPATNAWAASITASFVDATVGNFRLQSGDTVAKELGTNLSAVGAPQFQFAIDGNGFARPVGAAWDIGADEQGSTGGGGGSAWHPLLLRQLAGGFSG